MMAVGMAVDARCVETGRTAEDGRDSCHDSQGFSVL